MYTAITKGTWRLQRQDGSPVKINETAENIRGEKVRVTGGEPPHKPGSTGRVFYKDSVTGFDRSSFPSVFNFKWVNTDGKT